MLAPQHPEWQDQEPFKSVLAGDLKASTTSRQLSRHHGVNINRSVVTASILEREYSTGKYLPCAHIS